MLSEINQHQINSFKEAFQNNTAKTKEKLPLLYNQKILTKSNRLPDNRAKMLGVGITLKKTPQYLNCQPRGFVNLEMKHRQCQRWYGYF